MRAKVAKKLRKEAKEQWMTPAKLEWVNYETIKNGAHPWQVQVVLAECGKAIYKELKKEYEYYKRRIEWNR